MSSFGGMKKLLMAAGVWQLYRMGQRRRMSLRRSRRTRNVLFVAALAGGGLAAYAMIARQRTEPAQRWPSRKKLQRDARQAEARMRAQQGNEKPPDIRVERNAGTDLKVPLGDITR